MGNRRRSGAPADAAVGWLLEGDPAQSEYGAGRRNSVHEAGLADLLAMARLKDCLPQHRALITVQPQRIDWGEARGRIETIIP